MHLIQLPNDAQLTGLKQVKPYDWQQVFSSQSANFIGTEKDFLNAGHAYAYVQTSKFTRAVINQ